MTSQGLTAGRPGSRNPTAKTTGRKGIRQDWHDIAVEKVRLIFEAAGLGSSIVGVSG
jgi:hypothetical protein